MAEFMMLIATIYRMGADLTTAHDMKIHCRCACRIVMLKVMSGVRCCIFFFLVFDAAGGVLDPGTGAPDASDPDVRFWLDASDSSTLWADTNGTVAAANGGFVARWDDKSMRGVHVIQGNVTNMPVYTNGWPGLGNAPALFFLGSEADGDALISTNGNATGIAGNANLTVVTVWQNTGFGTRNYQHTFHMGNSSLLQAYGHSVARSGGAGTFISNHYWGDGFNTQTIVDTNPHYAVSSYDGSVDAWFLDGLHVGEREVSLNIGSTQLTVGSRINPIIEGFVGYLAEVVVFAKVLEQSERVLLAQYVESKYGIVSEFDPAPSGLIDPSSGTPNAMHPNLRLWLDADDSSTVWADEAGTIPATNGAAVARWDDKSLSRIVCAQPGAGNRPVYTSAVSGMEGRGAVQFVGGSNGDALTSNSGNSTGISGRDDFTLITVWQNTGFTGQNYQHTFHFGQNAPRQAYGHSTSRSGNAGTPIGNHYWSGFFDVVSVPAATNVPRMVLSEESNETDTWYVNGALEGSNVVDIVLGTEQLQVGSRLTPFAEGFTGDLCEVILIDRILNDVERNALGYYVQEKYGLAIDGAAVELNEPYIEKVTYRHVGAPELVLIWSSETNNTYRIDAADFPGGTWETMVTNVVGEANSTTYTNSLLNPDLLRKVFRVGRE